MRCAIFLILFLCNAYVMAQQDPVIVHNGGAVGDHSVIYPPADQPNVYYDSYNQLIIIDGFGEVSYYDVEISPVVSSIPVITAQVDGEYDTIDVSTLGTGSYDITIYSPTGNIFEGTFYIY